MRIDLHLHTHGSWDSLSDPEEVLERARARGIQRFAITDHDRVEVALQMAARHPDEVIPGEEIRTAEGFDLIGLYLSSLIPRGTPARECCERIRAQGGIVYLPHPYAPGKGGGGRFAEDIVTEVDVVEVFNARLRTAGRNRKAVQLAAGHGRLAGAGSDAHTPGEVGNGWVEVPPHPNSAPDLLRALRGAGVGGQKAPLHVFLGSNWAKLRKRLNPTLDTVPGAPRS